MVRAALRYSVTQYSCLEGSLTLWYLLRRKGIPACLRIGVRKENGKFEAHAWGEHGGEALNQDEAMHRHYAAFEQYLPVPPAEQPSADSSACCAPTVRLWSRDSSTKLHSACISDALTR